RPFPGRGPAAPRGLLLTADRGSDQVGDLVLQLGISGSSGVEGLAGHLGALTELFDPVRPAFLEVLGRAVDSRSAQIAPLRVGQSVVGRSDLVSRPVQVVHQTGELFHADSVTV